MAVKRIDLSSERGAWEDAVLGEEVRAAGISSLQKTEDVINETVNNVNRAATDVQSAAADAAQVAKDAEATVIRANETVDHADAILGETTRQASDILADAEQQSRNAAVSAELAETWAVGGNNSSRYHAEQASSSAKQAENAAERAAALASIVPPNFRINWETMELIQESAATGIEFSMDADKVLSFDYTI